MLSLSKHWAGFFNILPKPGPRRSRVTRSR
jgi:hypothetical protein